MQQLDEGALSEALAHLDADFDEDNVDKVSSLKPHVRLPQLLIISDPQRLSYDTGAEQQQKVVRNSAQPIVQPVGCFYFSLSTTIDF
jgi:hypothetical protein